MENKDIVEFSELDLESVFLDNLESKVKRSSILKTRTINLDICEDETDYRYNRRSQISKRVSFADTFQVKELNTGNVYDIPGRNALELSKETSCSIQLQDYSPAKDKENIGMKSIRLAAVKEIDNSNSSVNQVNVNKGIYEATSNMSLSKSLMMPINSDLLPKHSTAIFNHCYDNHSTVEYNDRDATVIQKEGGFHTSKNKCGTTFCKNSNCSKQSTIEENEMEMTIIQKEDDFSTVESRHGATFCRNTGKQSTIKNNGVEITLHKEADFPNRCGTTFSKNTSYNKLSTVENNDMDITVIQKDDFSIVENRCGVTFCKNTNSNKQSTIKEDMNTTVVQREKDLHFRESRHSATFCKNSSCNKQPSVENEFSDMMMQKNDDFHVVESTTFCKNSSQNKHLIVAEKDMDMTMMQTEEDFSFIERKNTATFCEIVTSVSCITHCVHHSTLGATLANESCTLAAKSPISQIKVPRNCNQLCYSSDLNCLEEKRLKSKKNIANPVEKQGYKNSFRIKSEEAEGSFAINEKALQSDVVPFEILKSQSGINTFKMKVSETPIEVEDIFHPSFMKVSKTPIEVDGIFHPSFTKNRGTISPTSIFDLSLSNLVDVMKCHSSKPSIFLSESFELNKENDPILPIKANSIKLNANESDMELCKKSLKSLDKQSVAPITALSTITGSTTLKISKEDLKSKVDETGSVTESVLLDDKNIETPEYHDFVKAKKNSSTQNLSFEVAENAVLNKTKSRCKTDFNLTAIPKSGDEIGEKRLAKYPLREMNSPEKDLNFKDDSGNLNSENYNSSKTLQLLYKRSADHTRIDPKDKASSKDIIICSTISSDKVSEVVGSKTDILNIEDSNDFKGVINKSINEASRNKNSSSPGMNLTQEPLILAQNFVEAHNSSKRFKMDVPVINEQKSQYTIDMQATRNSILNSFDMADSTFLNSLRIPSSSDASFHKFLNPPDPPIVEKQLANKIAEVGGDTSCNYSKTMHGTTNTQCIKEKMQPFTSQTMELTCHLKQMDTSYLLNESSTVRAQNTESSNAHTSKEKTQYFLAQGMDLTCHPEELQEPNESSEMRTKHSQSSSGNLHTKTSKEKTKYLATHGMELTCHSPLLQNSNQSLVINDTGDKYVKNSNDNLPTEIIKEKTLYFPSQGMDMTCYSPQLQDSCQSLDLTGTEDKYTSSNSNLPAEIIKEKTQYFAAQGMEITCHPVKLQDTEDKYRSSNSNLPAEIIKEKTQYFAAQGMEITCHPVQLQDKYTSSNSNLPAEIIKEKTQYFAAQGMEITCHPVQLQDTSQSLDSTDIKDISMNNTDDNLLKENIKNKTLHFVSQGMDMTCYSPQLQDSSLLLNTNAMENNCKNNTSDNLSFEIEEKPQYFAAQGMEITCYSPISQDSNQSLDCNYLENKSAKCKDNLPIDIIKERTQYFAAQGMEMTCHPRHLQDICQSLDSNDIKDKSMNNTDYLPAEYTKERTLHFTSQGMEMTCHPVKLQDSCQLLDSSSMKDTFVKGTKDIFSVESRKEKTQHFVAQGMELTCCPIQLQDMCHSLDSNDVENKCTKNTNDKENKCTKNTNDNLPLESIKEKAQYLSAQTMEMTCTKEKTLHFTSQGMEMTCHPVKLQDSCQLLDSSGMKDTFVKGMKDIFSVESRKENTQHFVAQGMEMTCCPAQLQDMNHSLDSNDVENKCTKNTNDNLPLDSIKEKTHYLSAQAMEMACYPEQMKDKNQLLDSSDMEEKNMCDNLHLENIKERIQHFSAQGMEMTCCPAQLQDISQSLDSNDVGNKCIKNTNKNLLLESIKEKTQYLSAQAMEMTCYPGQMKDKSQLIDSSDMEEKNMDTNLHVENTKERTQHFSAQGMDLTCYTVQLQESGSDKPIQIRTEYTKGLNDSLDEEPSKRRKYSPIQGMKLSCYPSQLQEPCPPTEIKSIDKQSMQEKITSPESFDIKDPVRNSNFIKSDKFKDSFQNSSEDINTPQLGASKHTNTSQSGTFKDTNTSRSGAFKDTNTSQSSVSKNTNTSQSETSSNSNDNKEARTTKEKLKRACPSTPGVVYSLRKMKKLKIIPNLNHKINYELSETQSSLTENSVFKTTTESKDNFLEPATENNTTNIIPLPTFIEHCITPSEQNNSNHRVSITSTLLDLPLTISESPNEVDIDHSELPPAEEKDINVQQSIHQTEHLTSNNISLKENKQASICLETTPLNTLRANSELNLEQGVQEIKKNSPELNASASKCQSVIKELENKLNSTQVELNNLTNQLEKLTASESSCKSILESSKLDHTHLQNKLMSETSLTEKFVSDMQQLGNTKSLQDGLIDKLNDSTSELKQNKDEQETNASPAPAKPTFVESSSFHEAHPLKQYAQEVEDLSSQDNVITIENQQSFTSSFKTPQEKNSIASLTTPLQLSVCEVNKYVHMHNENETPLKSIQVTESPSKTVMSLESTELSDSIPESITNCSTSEQKLPCDVVTTPLKSNQTNISSALRISIEEASSLSSSVPVSISESSIDSTQKDITVINTLGKCPTTVHPSSTHAEENITASSQKNLEQNVENKQSVSESDICTLSEFKEIIKEASSGERCYWKLKTLKKNAAVFKLEWGPWIYKCSLLVHVKQENVNESSVEFEREDDEQDKILDLGYKVFQYFVKERTLTFPICTRKLVLKLSEYSSIACKVENLMRDIVHMKCSPYAHKFSDEIDPFRIKIDVISMIKKSSCTLTLCINLHSYPSEIIVPELKHEIMNDITHEIKNAVSLVKPGRNYIWNIAKAAHSVV